ncbi:hypothetical protein BHM03_00033079 [Ensete ventricosum]|nr:hypothetical protein BHM03_00033079 [Ensete ventricosum]
MLPSRRRSRWNRAAASGTRSLIAFFCSVSSVKVLPRERGRGRCSDGFGGEDNAQDDPWGSGLRSRGRSPPNRLLARSAREFPLAWFPWSFFLLGFGVGANLVKLKVLFLTCWILTLCFLAGS